MGYGSQDHKELDMAEVTACTHALQINNVVIVSGEQ